MIPDNRDWLEKVMKRLPLTQPGTLVVSSEGIGVFMGNRRGSDRVYGVKRGERMLLENYPPLGTDW